MFEEDDSWDQAEKTRSETKSSGGFARLEGDGDSMLMVFPSKPFGYKQVWNQRENRSEIYDPAKHDGERPTGRFAFPVFVPIAGSKEYQPMVYDASGQTFDVIKSVRDKYGPATLFEVKREGTGKKTKYHVLFERELKDKELEYLKGLEAADAEAMTLGSGSKQEPADMPKGEDPWAE